MKKTRRRQGKRQQRPRPAYNEGRWPKMEGAEAWARLASYAGLYLPKL